MAGTSLRDLLPEILSLILEELPDLYSLFSAARSLSRPDVWGDLPRISRQIFRCTCLDAKMDERASLPKVFWGLLSATECRELDGNALRRLFDEGWKVSIGLGLEEALIPIGMVLARRLSSEEAIGFLIGLCVRCAPPVATLGSSKASYRYWRRSISRRGPSPSKVEEASGSTGDPEVATMIRSRAVGCSA
ncbi:hypothetical protein H112_02173 [Trichophyton rubrum D6]|uniref:Uncharacterized protein n=2 Tax=Trichophyton TaxID=5550 RepID=A0A022WAQ8_TRIRU|nr:hypothetical protein H100_02170 [Trichophyton rubrum MR850]EZF44569.1 hypothetical protein H102_02168 [Trichophyton rubrum CBS 100081]EZF55206.1 hypothetical protein H103_02177 [Trichophyton rubrum CBS 288.86]EZF65841.1 hypothetical protein H104_02153 [Trichophyton rubrum CBS 289.86]EZF76424.1 hypothetical protein H105_02187 [Trichophyton soudanense CBS 452.61]EZF87101.1 hypothetical protein H110_02173 [Trichophyton rubrum MR1448]EZF97981.1 hypothetical protein H113_02176 [Trichophyton rub